MNRYKIIMTGGGSAGHVTPNLALVPKLKKAGFEIKYIGSKDGIEKDIIKKEGIEYYSISSGKLRRYFDIKNFTDPFKVMKGVCDAFLILGREKPDVIFSKGGFVTVPVVIAASMRNIPVVSHESDMTPGLANKLASPFCNKLCVTFPESVKLVKGNKGIVTGTPIRESLFEGNKNNGRRFLNFETEKDIILVMGGSLGSKIINDTIRNNLKELLLKFNIVHLCGKGNLDKNLKNIKGYRQFEYLREELPDVINAADYLVSRAGANSIFEILALKKPNILIPLSKKASRGDQVLNAKSFEKSGYSIVIEEENLTDADFMTKIKYLKDNKEKFIKNMENSKSRNGVDNIINVILNSIRK
ncbi:undecaprenyldiphospho-muramoylpentapeptide beta-N-acetylglucosaminyltransferase [Clostridium fallax]|uniref:UDP-N-acetylglucosamine--N-acetylmuramyl-(pentapeptide) pyrophosphoryl-undecaprenol N-acetylglucosamine transferase n=1 Tax=Clostridium fallax TaxID=1533 RepID=A0A1M4UNF5_9CLOT|nr:undecaprenyldiphospho-muramoylpentapeptide beta-N-acetylglucosaminyltransferase [Clostridium fallax]SHE58188.1 UDP-N-acetylglucosamine-N-acetylmuramylpentapeptide N-acetylglucosamine transferase [Clostridium fallax]SQB07657.1 undecaprenyldiphospho-muramoylpentapeptide beta-N-acetylglucosaminyltransferase [Clostridium fallax]